MQFKISTLFFYIFKWLVITIVIGACIGTASAGFLISLDWVTNYRVNHLWLIAMLPIGGLLIGLLYHYYGKNVAAGNHLLLDTIHEPKAIIPFKMAQTSKLLRLELSFSMLISSNSCFLFLKRLKN